MKQKQQHHAIGLKRPNVMLDEKKSRASSTPQQTNGRSMDTSNEDSSEEDDVDVDEVGCEMEETNADSMLGMGSSA